MRRIVFATAVASMLALFGCKKKGSSEYFDKFQAHADKLCACKGDKAAECMKTENEDWAKWGTEYAKNAGKAENPEPEELKRGEEITKRINECAKRITDEAAKAAAGSATADKPADPPADKPADKPADPKAADKPADKPADPKAADKPADPKAADKPADTNPADAKPADKPAVKTAPKADPKKEDKGGW